ncbi:MAG: CotH kinase family protein [Phaeodactylibacter sp.]|nr:CotH kinase family protein [Phaeodactylibacter sp.]MCB9053002.1 CotH kinase family protein [Lewinellaceae bacterium]
MMHLSIRLHYRLFSKRAALLALFFLIGHSSFSQNPFPEPGLVYRDDIVPRIDIFLPPDSLAIMLAPGNETSDYHWHATYVFDNGSIRDTVENVGFRLRGNTSRYAAKKSFKVSFNTYESGRKWYGVEKLNLNGEHNDPTVSRSKACWDMLRDMRVPAPRANHVRLYVNGENYGLYANIEHIDEEFAGLRFGNKDGNLYKCLWPADLAYLGADPDLYKFFHGGRQAYELHINEEENDYSDLAHFIDVLNNTPTEELPCELEQVFNVDTYLRAIAFDILSGNWDGPIYNKNNFYLYHNLSTGQFEYIPYDLDNTLGIDWFNIDWANRDMYSWSHPDEPRPIYERLMEIPEYRKRYSYYMSRFVEEAYTEEALFPYFDEIKNRIASYVQTDPYFPLDYGFSFNDFHNAFENETPYFHTKSGLKHFVTARRNATLEQLQVGDIAPVLTGLQHNRPNELQELLIAVHAEDDQQIEMAELCYQLNGQGSTICVALYDDGAHQDGAAGDGLYGTAIPALNEPAVVHYFIQASDNIGQLSRLPFCGAYQLAVGSSSAPLAINEFMASNDRTIADEAGEYEDWVEIYNYGTEAVYLGNRYLSDNPDNPTKWQFPDIWIQAGEFILIWCDDDADQGQLHATYKLDADGEYIGIFDEAANNFALIDGLEFGEQVTDQAIGRLPNGTGNFQVVHPTPGASNQPLSSVAGKDSVQGISVYPNPFRETVTLEAKGAGVFQFRLSNALGQSIQEGNGWRGQPLELDLSGLPAGLYLISVQEDGRAAQSEKLIKE